MEPLSLRLFVSDLNFTHFFFLLLVWAQFPLVSTSREFGSGPTVLKVIIVNVSNYRLSMNPRVVGLFPGPSSIPGLMSRAPWTRL